MMRTPFIRPRMSIDWQMTEERDCPKDFGRISMGTTEMLIHNEIRSLHRACRTTGLAWVLLTGALASAQSDTDIPKRGEIKEVQQRLRASDDIMTLARPASAEAAVPQDESKLAKPEQRALAIASNASYVAPGELRSQGGILRATLVVTKAYNTIGEDEDFSGVFVQHCHILDHEDQGMMQLVEVVDPNGRPAVATKLPGHNSSTLGTVNENSLQVTEPYRATSWKLPDSTGTMHSLGEFQKDATVLFFFQGHGCLHCAEQITAFSTRADEFQKLGVTLVGISTDSVDSLRTALESAKCRFPLVADPQNLAFRDYNCFDGKPLHGTFVLDSELNVRWQLVSTQPFMSVDTVLAVTRELIASRKQSISSNQTKDVNNE